MLKNIIKALKRRRPFTVYGDNGKVYRFKTAAEVYHFIHR